MNDSERRVKSRFFILRNGDRIAAVALLIVFTAFGVASLGLERGILMQPGPGLWPTFLAVSGALLAVVLLIVGREVPVLAKSGTFKTFCVTLGCMSILPIAYIYLGFIPSATISLFLMIYLIASYKWYAALVASVIGAAAIYLLFAIGLALPISAI